jgi:hypothetical protein
MEIVWTYNTTAGSDIDVEYEMDWQWYEEIDFDDLPNTNFFNNLQKLEQ